MSLDLVVHIAAGGLGIVFGATALAVRKGGWLHRGSGIAFVAAMLAMAGAATLLALRLPNWANLPGALFASYLVVTGWASLARGRSLARSAEHVGLVLGGAACACALLLAFEAQASATGLINGKPAPLFAIVAALAACALALDVRVMRPRDLDRPRQLGRHIWRMCTALFFGTGSFFLGQQQVLPVWLQGSPVLFVLAFAPLGLMAFWLAKTLTPKRPVPISPA